MNSKKSFIRFIALSMIFLIMASGSLCVHAEPDESTETPISEQPSVQESIEEPSFEEPYSEPEIPQIPEQSELSEDDPPSEPSELSQAESSDYEESYVFSEPEPEPSYYEPSYYYDPSQTEENPFPWAQESTDYYYHPEYSYEESYYYSEPEYSYLSSYEESSYYYYYEDESAETTESEEESSVVYHETSVDSSELTSKDWENLKNSMSSDMRLNNGQIKSSDNAVRDIKDNNDGVNDSINYLVWGLILIVLGAGIIVFVVMSTVRTKRKMTENLQQSSKK